MGSRSNSLAGLLQPVCHRGAGDLSATVRDAGRRHLVRRPAHVGASS